MTEMTDFRDVILKAIFKKKPIPSQTSVEYFFKIYLVLELAKYYKTVKFPKYPA